MKSSSNILQIKALVAGCVLLFSTAGCGRTFTEELVREGIAGPAAPDWVKGNPQLPSLPGHVCFVGRAVGYTVLDEPAAVAAAREDVYKQVAGLVSTRVTGRSYRSGDRENPESGFYKRGVHGFTTFDDDRYIRFLAGPEMQQFIEREAALFTNGVAGELIDQDVYFEAWDVRDQALTCWGQAARGTIRYKCWLLTSIPKEKLERRIEDFRKLVADAYERFVDDRQRAIAWAEDDRERRILREEDDRKWARCDHIEDRGEARDYRQRIMKAHSNVSFRVLGHHAVIPVSASTVNMQ